MMGSESTYTTILIEDGSCSFLQVFQIYQQHFLNGITMPLGKHEYPRVPITEKFNDLLLQISHEAVDKGCMTYRIKECLSEQMYLSESRQEIMLEKGFSIGDDKYFIIYVPTQHWVYSGNVKGIIQHVSQGPETKEYKSINVLIVLPYEDYKQYRNDEIQDTNFEKTVVRYFDPEKLTKYVWDKLSETNRLILMS